MQIINTIEIVCAECGYSLPTIGPIIDSNRGVYLFRVASCQVCAFERPSNIKIKESEVLDENTKSIRRSRRQP